jgi:uncharacterized OB-fold protein
MTLLDRDPTGPSAWNDEMQVTNRYTFGVAGESFFREIKEEARIFGTRCNNCQRVYVPASIFCERCLEKLDEWLDVGTTGEIETFTHLYVNYDGTSRSEPETIAFIKLGDGGIIHRLISKDAQQIEIGMLAKAIFKPKAEREGSILDIDHFELLTN